ncbi:Glutamate receptor 2.9 [Glycine max]|nr:Glutamate receptor 2.9 [Glycine max]
MLHLWLTTGVAFIFTGFIVWFFEHRINSEFRVTPKNQIGMALWFSFSTLVLNLVVDALTHEGASVRIAACICLRSVSRSIKNLSVGRFTNKRVVFPVVQLFSDLFTSVQVFQLYL